MRALEGNSALSCRYIGHPAWCRRRMRRLNSDDAYLKTLSNSSESDFFLNLVKFKRSLAK